MFLIDSLKMGAEESKYMDMVAQELDIEDIEKTLENISDGFSISESSSDSESCEELTTDANETNSNADLFNINNLSQIEAQLDESEKVSLIYLLYEDPLESLNEIKHVLQQQSTNFLCEWYRKYAFRSNVQSILLEAFCTIQSYQILKGLNQDKKELQARFLPRNKYVASNLSRLRKALYLISEDLMNLQTQRVISEVLNQLNERLPFLEVSYFEMSLLYWEHKGHISKSNLSVLIKAFKTLELEECSSCLESLMKSNKNNLPIAPSPCKILNQISPQLVDSSVRQLNEMDSDNARSVLSKNRYDMEAQKPGLCLIINQEHFYKEFDLAQYGLKAGDIPSLENRDGTDKDRNKLQETLQKFNFAIISKNNLRSDQVISEIRKGAEQAQEYSAYFVCILSHGIEGCVYGVNSVAVPVDDIYEALNKTPNQPKILILQACQGNICQEVKIVRKGDLVTDGPGSSNGAPRSSDIMVFWATVPGYAAIRDVNNGSWFIQVLCENIDKFASALHFHDICVLVKKEISQKSWNKNEKHLGMVCIIYSTLLKFLYFPSKQ